MSHTKTLSVKVAVLGSYTVDLLGREIQRTLQKSGMEPTIYVGGFNQYRQSLLNPQSDYYHFAPDVTLLAIDAMDLFAAFFFEALQLGPEQKKSLVIESVRNFQQLLQRNFEGLPQNRFFVSQLVIPPSTMLGPLGWNSDVSVQEHLADFNQKLCATTREFANCWSLDFPSLALTLGYSRWFDPRLWYLARCRVGGEATSAIARQFTATLSALYRGSRKCLVLDLDNTLWGGVVGTESMDELQLGTEGIGLAFQEFQRLVLQLKKQGIVLAINSKNNYEEAISIIENHPSMILRKRDFAAIRINWSDKVTNMRELAEELGLSLDSMAYFDDDPFQRNLIASQLPEVFVVDVPKDPVQYCATLLNLQCFWTLSLTEEDRSRAELYEKRAERQQLRTSSGNLEDFYRSLDMKLTVRPASESVVPRVSQLTQRTNQFNLTTKRYDASDIRKFLSNPAAKVYTAELADRFGNEGVIGAAILTRSGRDWLVDTLLMSCRVIGRTVENAFLATLAEQVRMAGGRRLVGQYLPTARNACVANLYPSLGFQPGGQEGCWVLDLKQRQLTCPAWVQVILKNEMHSASVR